MTKYLVTRTVVLDAAGKGQDSAAAGSVLIVDQLTAGPSVDVTWLDDGGNEAGTAKGVLLGRKLASGAPFSGFKLVGTAGATVTLLIGPEGADAVSLSSSSFVIGHVIVDNEVEVKNDAGNPLAVSGPLTDVQLRAVAVPVSGPLTDAQLRAATVPVTSTTAAAETVADNADAQAAKGAAVLRGIVARLSAWNGATFDRLKIGAIAGSLLADMGDRAGRLVGIVYGSLGQLVQVATSGVNALAVRLYGGIFGDDVTDNNNAFQQTLTVAAVAAQYSYAQVKNPAASGKFVYVDEINAYFSVGAGADSIVFQLYDTDLATDSGALPSKYSGGAASSAHVRTTTSATAALGSIIEQRIVPSTATGDGVFKFVPPFRLDAGKGFAVRPGSVNETLNATIKIRER